MLNKFVALGLASVGLFFGSVADAAYVPNVKPGSVLGIPSTGTEGPPFGYTVPQILGYTPLSVTANLSDLANVSTARSNLGLGALAILNSIDSAHLSVGVAASNLGFTPAHSGANTDITSLGGLTTPLSIAQGGTGAASPSLVAGSNVTITGSWPNQTIATTSLSGPGSSVVGNVVLWNNTAGTLTKDGGFVPLNPANNLSELASSSTARANLGLGTLAILNSVDAAHLGSGVAASNLGFTPLNKAGDTMTGNLVIQTASSNSALSVEAPSLFEADINLFYNGTREATLFTNATNAFGIYDPVNNAVPFSYSSTGNTTIGETTKTTTVNNKLGIGGSPTYTLDAMNSSGDAVGRSYYTGSTTNSASRYFWQNGVQSWQIGTAYNYNGNELFISDASGSIEKIQIFPGSSGGVFFNTGSGALQLNHASGVPFVLNANSGTGFKSSVQFQLSGAAKGEFGVDVNNTSANTFYWWVPTNGSVMTLDNAGDLSLGIGANSVKNFTAEYSRSGDTIAFFENTHQTAGDGGITVDVGSASGADTSSLYMNFTKNGGATGVGSISRATANTVAYNTSSDRNLKDGIAPTRRGIDELMKVGVDDFYFKDDPNKTIYQGYIAQDLFDVYPDAVHVGSGDTQKDPWAVDYGRVTPLIVSSVQDQQREIEALKIAIALTWIVSAAGFVFVFQRDKRPIDAIPAT